MLVKALRERQQQRQQQQEFADETRRSSGRSPGGASSAVEKQIRLGLSRADELLNEDSLT